MDGHGVCNLPLFYLFILFIFFGLNKFFGSANLLYLICSHQVELFDSKVVINLLDIIPTKVRYALDRKSVV